jgi:hypothetical protein
MPKSTFPAAAKGLSDETEREDPVFAAIEEHKRIDAHTDRFSEQKNDKAFDASCRHVNFALWALAYTVPTSAAGIRAKLAYLSAEEKKYGEDFSGLLETCMQSIERSPALVPELNGKAEDQAREAEHA